MVLLRAKVLELLTLLVVGVPHRHLLKPAEFRNRLLLQRPPLLELLLLHLLMGMCLISFSTLRGRLLRSSRRFTPIPP